MLHIYFNLADNLTLLITETTSDGGLDKLTTARLSQELKSFNWLENKILNGSIEKQGTSHNTEKQISDKTNEARLNSPISPLEMTCKEGNFYAFHIFIIDI